MHIYIPDICSTNSILIFASRGQWEEKGGSILSQERGRASLTCCSLYCTVDFKQEKPEWSLLHLLSQEKYKHLGHTWYPVIQLQQTFDSWLLIASKPSWYLTTHATQILHSGKPWHTQTRMTVTARGYQIHTNLVIILSQRLLLLDVQHASGKYKTIPSLLLAIHALKSDWGNSNFTPIMAIKAHKVTPISRMGVFSTPEHCLHIGEQPADQYPTKALIH